MITTVSKKLLLKYDLKNSENISSKLIENNVESLKWNMFTRVGYKLTLKSLTYGTQWIYTEFDKFTSNIKELGIPNYKKIFDTSINNLIVKSNDNNNIVKKVNGKIQFSPYDYGVTNNGNNELYDSGTYGCMQVLSDNNILWAYNDHRRIGDIGIGNNKTSYGIGFKNWTFSHNADLYTTKILEVYIIVEELSTFKINTVGISKGDYLEWDSITNVWGVKQITYDTSCPEYEPNFIITLTGQSNSQGAESFYDSGNFNDQPHERIFGWNPTLQKWEIANLNTESLGFSWCKQLGSQCLAFHFAKRLVEGYADIRPGIINLGIGGQSISRWVKFEKEEQFYEYNNKRLKESTAYLGEDYGCYQGDIFDMHVNQIQKALASLQIGKTIDVILYHQGESDGWHVNKNYYLECLKKLIYSYRKLNWCNEKTPFIVGETTGANWKDDLGWEARNNELRNLNKDADPYTKCVQLTDLQDSKNENGHAIHFGSEAQREMGTRYFKAFRNMF